MLKWIAAGFLVVGAASLVAMVVYVNRLLSGDER